MKESAEARRERHALERWRLVWVLRKAGNVVLEEHRFCERRWRFDLALPQSCIALEVEGLNGRHQSTKGFLADMEKYNTAVVLGWRVIRVTTREVANGDALEWLARLGVHVETNAGDECDGSRPR